ncbi:hypothetical protein V8E54_002766 [Elaphomyces granulatus]
MGQNHREATAYRKREYRRRLRVKIARANKRYSVHASETEAVDEDQAEEIREVLDSNNADAPTRTAIAAVDSVGQVTSAQSTATRQDALEVQRTSQTPKLLTQQYGSKGTYICPSILDLANVSGSLLYSQRSVYSLSEDLRLHMAAFLACLLRRCMAPICSDVPVLYRPDPFPVRVNYYNASGTDFPVESLVFCQSTLTAFESILAPAGNATLSFVAAVIATSTADGRRSFTFKITAYKQNGNGESAYETFHAVCAMAPDVRWGTVKLPPVNAYLQLMGNTSFYSCFLRFTNSI